MMLGVGRGGGAGGNLNFYQDLNLQSLAWLWVWAANHQTMNAMRVVLLSLLLMNVTECIRTSCLCLCCCTQCVALSVFFRMCTSFNLICMCYVLWFRVDVIIRLSESAWEKARVNNNNLSHVPSKRKVEIKSGTSCCGTFVVLYIQPATSIDCLHEYEGSQETNGLLFVLRISSNWKWNVMKNACNLNQNRNTDLPQGSSAQMILQLKQELLSFTAVITISMTGIGKLRLLNQSQCHIITTQCSTPWSGKNTSTNSNTVKPVLNWANVCSPDILRTVQRTMIRFLIELFSFSSPNMVRTVRRTLLRSQLACNEMQASAQTCGRRAADSMIENVG